ncbi:hypothetical protein [Bradyrhizobium sp. CCGB20]|uniref:hypothetical protein n=1 Tax=Bradyrhizobium sp. CCGB20 TaxID=2949633 RepID=UPI0020B3C831|nr:hypothetical protein [Bradyrhizobium sp. CCGB20]MCP3402885.1 hypothetical protein [Bradyrhizobium sp. CCGB20]
MDQLINRSGIKAPTVCGILFLLPAFGIDSVLELKALFDRLDSLSAEQRSALLVNVAELPSDFSVICQSRVVSGNPGRASTSKGARSYILQWRRRRFAGVFVNCVALLHCPMRHA